MSSPPPGAASTPTARTGVPASSAPRLEPRCCRVPPNPPQEPAQRGRGSDPVSGSLAAFSRGAADGRAQRAPVAAGDTRPQNSLDTLTASGRPLPATRKQPAFPADARPLPREPLRGLVLDILTAGRSSGRDAREGQRGLLIPIGLFRGRAARTSDLCPLHLSFFLHDGGDGRPSRPPRGAGVRLGSGAA